MNAYPVRLGLTMWSHNNWQQTFYGSGTKPNERLEKYASVFHTVEGNTTFYATPNAATIRNWHASTHDEFRFTFKLPKNITHISRCCAVAKRNCVILYPSWNHYIIELGNGQFSCQRLWPRTFEPT